MIVIDDSIGIKYELELSIKLFHPVNSLVVSRNLWLILLSKICLFLDLAKNASKNF